MFSSVTNIVSPYGAYSHVQYLLSVISNVRSILHPPTHQSLSFAYSNYQQYSVEQWVSHFSVPKNHIGKLVKNAEPWMPYSRNLIQQTWYRAQKSYIINQYNSYILHTDYTYSIKMYATVMPAVSKTYSEKHCYND